MLFFCNFFEKLITNSSRQKAKFTNELKQKKRNKKIHNNIDNIYECLKFNFIEFQISIPIIPVC